MSQQLKRWESPRKPGRNQKGRGGSARQRQLKKQHKQFLKQLKAQARANAKQKDDAQASKTTPPPSSNSTLIAPCQTARKGKRLKSLALSFDQFLARSIGLI